MKYAFSPDRNRSVYKVNAVRKEMDDSGRLWIRDLDSNQREDLFEFGGMLLELMKKNPRIKRGTFMRRLVEGGEAERAELVLRSITPRSVDPYYIYWAYSYAQVYARRVRVGHKIDALHEKVCEELKIKEGQASNILHRLDVSAMMSLFMERQVKDSKGLVAMVNLEKALSGSPHAITSYFQHHDDGTQERAAIPFNPEVLTEGELMEGVARMRKELGKTVDFEALERGANPSVSGSED